MADMAFHSLAGLPNPDTHSEFYHDVPSKRLIAWFIDVAAIALITLVASMFTLFTALLIWPLIFGVISFLYRWVTLTTGSATWGMRVVAIEMRRPDGSKFDSTTAFLHTLGYVISVVTFPLQLISIALMLMSPRKQGLSDMVLGTAALNKSAQ